MNELAAARSFLFVPANRPERFAKAFASGADAVIIDLEDAVPVSDKTGARDRLATAFGHFTANERARLVVRINASGTPWHDDDLRWLDQTQTRPAAVMLPKAEQVADLQRLAQTMGPGGAVLALIESVAGLDGADALAATPGVLRLAFGNLDFQADLGLACDGDEAELAPVRLALALASRRAHLAAPIDGVTADLKDLTRLQADAARSRRGGFGGKLCIHPAQVASVNAAFSPTETELAWAQRVLQASVAASGAAISLDGRMIDAPVLRLAQQTLARKPLRST